MSPRTVLGFLGFCSIWMQFETTARQTQKRIIAILELQEETRAFVKEKTPHLYSKELIDVLFTHPYCKIAFVVEAGIAKRQTASLYLQTLKEHGVLQYKKVGREAYYLNHRLLEKLRTTE